MDGFGFYACHDEECENFGAPYHDDKAADCLVCGAPMGQIAEPDALAARQLELQPPVEVLEPE